MNAEHEEFVRQLSALLQRFGCVFWVSLVGYSLMSLVYFLVVGSPCVGERP